MCRALILGGAVASMTLMRPCCSFLGLCHTSAEVVLLRVGSCSIRAISIRCVRPPVQGTQGTATCRVLSVWHSASDAPRKCSVGLPHLLSFFAACRIAVGETPLRASECFEPLPTSAEWPSLDAFVCPRPAPMPEAWTSCRTSSVSAYFGGPKTAVPHESNIEVPAARRRGSAPSTAGVASPAAPRSTSDAQAAGRSRPGVAWLEFVGPASNGSRAPAQSACAPADPAKAAHA